MKREERFIDIGLGNASITFDLPLIPNEEEVSAIEDLVANLEPEASED